MSYPKHMNDEELVTFGFAVSPDDPSLAYHKLYPELSVRHRCSSCGTWSAVVGGKELVCKQCSQGKTPVVNRQFHKLYLCCNDEDCQTRRRALQMLGEAGCDTVWSNHDGFGEYVSLDPLTSMSSQQRTEFNLTINRFSVSKFGARKVVHPDSKRRSKLPK